MHFIALFRRRTALSDGCGAVFPRLYIHSDGGSEAMALMCPVVVSEVGGFSEMVKHTETGVTVYPDDSASIAWGILHTLNHPNWARNYALNARRSIDLLFNWPRIARLTVDVYRRVLRQRLADEVKLQST